MKALAEQMEIPRIEAKDSQLIFTLKKADLGLWSTVFAEFPGMRFAPSGDRIIYKYKGEPTRVGCAIMRKLYAENKEARK